MSDKRELYALLKEIDTLKRDVTRIERLVKGLLAEEERRDQRQSDLTTTLNRIIDRLEKERGYAPIDITIEQAVRAGFNKADVEKELDRILG